ncbi:hypothetical protein BDK51DRAFT_27603 [Blyttiomyces helicus]|uniref:CUB domain-containing protein n=1 Tax=Blyttiomyces helicus TaxID=388810 RepID=A0A4P9WP12_9FUNG|nr:hypothetical protein BDK51DRAFT_27603 [Blyttiomyces helicus]|eukprot:RKO93843.1 hypothetical protein BDK51DRAFT_27603 [Blyttiomyces helicus]
MASASFYPPQGQSCYGNYAIQSVASGVIASNYAGNYTSNMFCQWIVKAPIGSVVRRQTSSSYLHPNPSYPRRPHQIRLSDVANLCGLRGATFDDTIISSSNSLAVVFQSDEEVNYAGFVAKFTVLEQNSICASDADCANGGTCRSGTCVCAGTYSGALCIEETTGFPAFTPRQYHSTAWDPVSDTMYLTFGTGFTASYFSDMLTFAFGGSEAAIIDRIRWSRMV